MTASHIGRYEIQKELGKGYHGVVYLARDPHLERYVAIKMQRIRPEMREGRHLSLIEEARILSRLQHPNIVTIFDVGEYEGNFYFVLEFVDGVSIRDEIKKGGAFAIRRAVSIISSVLGGIAYMHEKGIIHGDLRPSNIMIEAEGVPKIMDFGIAMLIRSDKGVKHPPAGTPVYASPEYFQKAPLGPQSDIYSLGLVFYEMLTGRPAFTVDSPYTVMYRIVNQQMEPPSKTNAEVDPALDDIVQKAVEKDPAMRFRDAEEMKSALDQYLEPGNEADDNTPVQGHKEFGTVEFLLRRMRRNRDFPAFSKNIVEVNRKLSGTEKYLSVSDLANVILKDYALTNKLLRLVNSAFYGVLAGKITTVSRAVVLLGFDQVRLAAASLMLFDHLKGRQQTEKLMDAAVSSFVSGIFARKFASEAGVEKEEAFICGMLHKLGYYLVLFYLPEEFNEVNRKMTQKGIDEQTASRSVLGISYHELGMAIARSWKFPAKVIESMAPISPGRADAGKSENALLRGIANFASELCDIVSNTQGNDRLEALSQLSGRFEKVIQVSQKQLLNMLETSKAEIEKHSNILGVNVDKSLFVRRLIYEADRAGPQSAVDDAARESPSQGPNSETARHEDHGADEARAPEENSENSRSILVSGIQEITNVLVESNTLNDVVLMIIETMYRGFGFERVIFCVMDPKRNRVQARFGLGKDIDRLIKIFGFEVAGRRDVFGQAMTELKDVCVADSSSPGIKAHIPEWYRRLIDAPSFALYPIFIKQVAIGLFYVDRETGGPPIPDDRLKFMHTLRNQLLIAIRQGH